MAPEFRATLPPGTYFLGDICYVLDERLYDEVWGSAEYRDGLFEVGPHKHAFVVHGTSCGDGCFEGLPGGFCYPVDSGVLGLVHESLVDPNTDFAETNTKHTFTQPVTFTVHDGRFVLKDKTGVLLRIECEPANVKVT